ncbi:MAG: restriction endonuclease subunit S [Microcystaceae cyanobacterium]
MTDSNSMFSELPQGWRLVAIENCLTTIRGISFPKDAKKLSYQDDCIACLRTANIQEKVTWDDLWFVDQSYLRRNEQIIKKGDILISISNSLNLLGKVALVENIKFQSTLGTFIANLRTPKDLNYKYIYYYLSSQEFKNKVREKASTTTNISNISVGKLEKIEIKLPPLPEQHRIVEKIEELFSELDNGIASLKKALEQLKTYRQAVLKWAFEGKLTEAWRTEHQDSLEDADTLLQQIKAEREAHYQQQLEDWKQAVKDWEAKGKEGKKPTKLKKLKELPPLSEEELSALPQLPNGWLWVKLGNLCQEIFDGPFGSNLKTKDYTDYGVRVIRLENIGYLSFNDDKQSFISNEKFLTLQKHTVSENDLIFASFINEFIRATLLPKLSTQAIAKADCFCIRTFSKITVQKWLLYTVSSRYFYNQICNLVHGFTRPRVNTTQLKNLIIPLFSLKEQTQIVQEIESRLSICDQLEATLTENLDKAEALRQSILKRSFEGKLVPQNPDDEPASELLKRIQQDTPSPPKKTTRKRKAKTV